VDINSPTAKLVLDDGSQYEGQIFGAPQPVCGEVVFNTGMVGYPETLTDPSYSGQILVLTYPLIGNYGIPGREREDRLLAYFESERIHIRALIVADYSEDYSHWNAKQSLSAWMAQNNIPGLTGIDTRALTKKLRHQGTLLGRIICPGAAEPALKDPNLENLVKSASIPEPILYAKGNKKVILVDCGVKNNIIRAFLKRNITVLRVPWDYNFSKEKADGYIISNGPGDPKQCTATIEHTRKALALNTPILGICLGSQILGLAAGANTYKLKFGHRGQNQPCVESGTRRCYITSQNHGYAIETGSLPEDWREWFYNANDQTNEGIKHIAKPYFGTQFHPEASPGPDDTEFLFDMFLRAIES
jgi:carbamoyl-phosphate synthase small subunit